MTAESRASTSSWRRAGTLATAVILSTATMVGLALGLTAPTVSPVAPIAAHRAALGR